VQRNYPPCKLVDRIAAKVLPGRRATEDWYEVHMRYLSTVGKYGLSGYVREVDIETGQTLAPKTLEAYLPYFRSFAQVHTLKISGVDLARFLPAFGRYFGQFVPNLRSLHLPDLMGGAREILEFICKFPHLNDLSLIPRSPHYYVGLPPRLSMEHSPPLRGTLVLKGWRSIPVRFLLKIPGGLHFRSINAGGVDKEEMGGVLVACSSDLEVFSLRCQWRKFT